MAMEPKQASFMSKRVGTRLPSTGKSFSEALILALTDPQYDKRLFITFHFST